MKLPPFIGAPGGAHRWSILAPGEDCEGSIGETHSWHEAQGGEFGFPTDSIRWEALFHGVENVLFFSLV